MSTFEAARDGDYIRQEFSDEWIRDVNEQLASFRRTLNGSKTGTPERSRFPFRLYGAKSKTATTGTENVIDCEFHGVDFDPITDAESRLIASEYEARILPQAVFARGWHFPPDIRLWCGSVDGRWQVLSMQGAAQCWFGVTAEEIPQGASGPVDVITEDGGNPTRVDAVCYYSETIGEGVKVVGGFSPDGANYIFGAECEEGSGPAYEEGTGSGELPEGGIFIYT